MKKPDISQRPFSLSLEAIMNTSPDVLFQAWTKKFDLWFAAPETLLMTGEVNSVFFFETHFEEQRHPHYGRFLRIEENRLIELTWVTGIKGTKGEETVITVELEPYKSGTKLRLTHAGFPDEESRTGHEQAWPIILENLDKKILSESVLKGCL